MKQADLNKDTISHFMSIAFYTDDYRKAGKVKEHLLMKLFFHRRKT